MITVNGIYNDIMESTYHVDITNDDKEYKFYFSSQSYANKFSERYSDFINVENKKLELKYKALIKADLIFIFNLYQLIEKRGFRVEVDSKILKESPLFNLEIEL